MKVIKSILVYFFIGANIATILLLWVCCAVTYLHPEHFPRLTVLTLAFPAFLIVNVLFVIFWLIFKVKHVWIPLMGLLACGSFVRDYFPINLPSTPADSTWTVISYNSRSWGGKDADLEDGTNAVLNFLLASDAHIICMQETAPKKNFHMQMQEQGYEYLNKKEFTVFSRLPILSADTLTLSGHSAYALRAFLLDGQDTIMLINQHLRSNKLSPEMKKAYGDALSQHESDSIKKELVPILRLLSVASPIRAAQADSLTSIIEAWLPRPVIVCGDINDTPISYTYRVQAHHLTSAYCQSGNGVGFTFQEKGFPVRIDHILFSDDHWKSYQTRVERGISCSDHFPILTKLVKKTP